MQLVVVSWEVMGLNVDNDMAVKYAVFDGAAVNIGVRSFKIANLSTNFFFPAWGLLEILGKENSKD